MDLALHSKEEPGEGNAADIPLQLFALRLTQWNTLFKMYDERQEVDENKAANTPSAKDNKMEKQKRSQAHHVIVIKSTGDAQ
ncbi:hypothetical protein WN51_05599 [Melipona quadrifasciata]|uniref:Uncharacterized protein n=1 Tax=Melipona quadrifasciata TaxID=166423 RepID=A0A0M8ZT43_9HYME|nr:hypothetical protein WN51_05599 [Melipona quadrifasciata]